MDTPEELFKANCSLCGYVFSKEFIQYYSHKEDLMQEGYIALWKCCNNFNPELGFSFCTYACKAMRNSMLSYINNQIAAYYAVDSLDKVICEDYAGGVLLLKDILCEENFEDTKYLIKVCLDKMSVKDRAIIEDLMRGYTQDNMAVKYNVSQKYVSVRLNTFRELIKEEMKNG